MPLRPRKTRRPSTRPTAQWRPCTRARAGPSPPGNIAPNSHLKWSWVAFVRPCIADHCAQALVPIPACPWHIYTRSNIAHGDRMHIYICMYHCDTVFDSTKCHPVIRRTTWLCKLYRTKRKCTSVTSHACRRMPPRRACAEQVCGEGKGLSDAYWIRILELLFVLMHLSLSIWVDNCCVVYGIPFMCWMIQFTGKVDDIYFCDRCKQNNIV